ncbi:MAG: U32 family peptidase, partial [Lachnospiraceae bacterium]|nr:U32 family peptidase [Lachnospiraceae bacterium]
AAGLRAVTNAGADAVYIGGSRFGARAYADNPEEEELLDAIDYAHLRGVKVYMTVNTLLKEAELSELYDYLLPYYQRGLDAVLVQDFGVLKKISELFPDLPVHASTQMTVTGPESAALLKRYGVTRVVPARELSLKELKEIRDEGLEVEIFVHGALCVCYSGQCLYSSLLGGRSGNRGRCAQPCRLLYLKDNDDFDGSESILNRKEARHFLSTKDLAAIDQLPEFFETGISSLKIEGRMKQPAYAAGVVSIYRKYIDLYAADPKHFRVDPADRQLLWNLYNRSGFTDGYFHRHNGPEMMALIKHELTPAEADTRHEAYAVMEERFIGHPRKIPAAAFVKVMAGENLSAVFSADGCTVTVTGDPVQSASNRPLLKERIAECIGKMGDTDFEAETVEVETDQASFVPIRALNELRREGLARLREALLERSLRGVPEAAVVENAAAAESSPASSEASVSVLVSTEEQLEAVLYSAETDLIYLEGSLLLRGKNFPEDAVRLVEKVCGDGKKCGIAMPLIDRGDSASKKLTDAVPQLLEAGAEVLLVRSIETMARLIRLGYKEKLRADSGIYTYNHDAQIFLRKHGILKDTAPVELNRREYFRRKNADSELIVYGRLPLMVTAQCLAKNTTGCSKRFEKMTLTDRMGVKFTVGCDCIFCYNIIFNSLPLSLLSEYGTIQRMGFEGIRLQFTLESGEETAEVLRSVSEMLSGTTVKQRIRSTKGHFLRGVE